MTILEHPTGAVERKVFDAEIVDETEQPKPTGLRRAAYIASGRTVHVVTTVAKTGLAQRAGKALKAAPRRAVRGSYTTGQGVVSWARRAGQGITHGVLREQVRLAHLAGDRVALAEWTERLQDAKDARMRRMLMLPKALLAGLLVTGVVTTSLAFLLFVGAVGAWLMPGGLGWTDWWGLVHAVLGWIAWGIKVALVAAACVTVPLVVALAWREGKRVADPPRWLLTEEERAVIGSEITPSKVVVALRDLGIAALRNAIKEMPDGGAGMLSPITIAGCGVEVDVALPSGVATDEIQKRRRKLAENLDRHEHEVYITVPAKARTVRVWIADSGALDEPIGPSPLVVDETLTADLYTGRAPWGQDLRGDAAALSLLQRHLLITGLSNQGKTASLRALALWLALDTTVEFRIADLKGVGDWHMFAPLCSTLIEGPTDDHVIAATEMLEAGVAEMERRMAALDKDAYPNGVTRDLARRKGSGFHPLFLIVDEAQVAFMCPAVDDSKRPYGGTKATSRYFMAARKLHNQGRAVNVHLWQGTQDPTDQNLPKLVREGAHIRASLVVGTEEQARMALGDKAVNGGAAPHLLRQGLDKGTIVVAGDGVKLEPGQSSITIRTHFIDGEAATEIVQRAVDRRRKAGRDIAPAPVEDDEPVDHLENVVRAMRDEPRVRTQVVLQRLVELDQGEYEDWNFGTLKTVLGRDGVKVVKSNGQMVVRLSDVQGALNRRKDGPLRLVK